MNLVDTADAYGPETDELLIAEALHPYPKGLVIATKGGLTRPGPGSWVPDCRPERLSQCVDQSLKRLKLDRIDLYQLHTVDRKVPIEKSLGALKAAQDAGKIRHVGLSNVTTQEIERAKKILPIVSIQNRYNIEDRDSEEVLSYCEKEKMGFLPWAPVGGSGRSSLTKTGNPLEAEAKLVTSAPCNSRSRGCCRNRRLYCQSREHRRLPISKRIWPQRNFSLLQRNGRIEDSAGRVEQLSPRLRHEQRKRVASIF